MYFLGKMVDLHVSEIFSRELLVSGMFLHLIGSVWNYWGFPSGHWLLTYGDFRVRVRFRV